MGETLFLDKIGRKVLKNAGFLQIMYVHVYMRNLYLYNRLFHRLWLSSLYTVLK